MLRIEQLVINRCGSFNFPINNIAAQQSNTMVPVFVFTDGSAVVCGLSVRLHDCILWSAYTCYCLCSLKRLHLHGCYTLARLYQYAASARGKGRQQ